MTFRIWLQKDTRPSCQGCYLPGLMAFLGLDGKDCCLKKTSGVWWRKTGNEPQITKQKRVLNFYVILLTSHSRCLALCLVWYESWSHILEIKRFCCLPVVEIFLFLTLFSLEFLSFFLNMKNIYPRLKSSLKTETCYERKSLETSSTILGRTMFGIFNINQ